MAKEILLSSLIYDMKLISQKKTIKKDFKAGVAKQIAPPLNSLNKVNAIEIANPKAFSISSQGPLGPRDEILKAEGLAISIPIRITT